MLNPTSMEERPETPFSIAWANAMPWTEYLATNVGKQFTAEKYAYCRAAAQLLGGEVAQFASLGAIYPADKLEAQVNSAVIEKFGRMSGNVELERYKFDEECKRSEKQWQEKTPYCQAFARSFVNSIQTTLFDQILLGLEEFCRFEQLKQGADFRYLINILLSGQKSSQHLAVAIGWLQEQELQDARKVDRDVGPLMARHVMDWKRLDDVALHAEEIQPQITEFSLAKSDLWNRIDALAEKIGLIKNKQFTVANNKVAVAGAGLIDALIDKEWIEKPRLLRYIEFSDYYGVPIKAEERGRTRDKWQKIACEEIERQRKL